MWKGEVLSVHSAPEAGEPMQSPGRARAVAGRGIEGDRYFKETGFFSHKKGPRRQVTLFESEVLDILKRDHRLELSAEECRMNIVTRGVPLTHLVGKSLRVGEATLWGLRLNEPCRHLQEVAGKRIVTHLIHRCGLNAENLEGGWIQPGDVVEECRAALRDLKI